MKNVCKDHPVQKGLLLYVMQEQLFAKLHVAIFAVFPRDQRMDMYGDAFFDVVKVVCRDLFVTVDAHGRKLRMAGDQNCLQILFHHLSSYYIPLFWY
jgi:hypothetical protein